MPPLAQWLGMFLAASVISIAATFLALRWCCRKELKGIVNDEAQQPVLSSAGRLTIAGIGIVVVVLLTASALGRDLGLPTCIAALTIAIALSIRERPNPLKLTKDISWSILPLVAGLFVLVEAVGNAGALSLFEGGLRTLQHWHPLAASAAAAFSVAIGTNLVNNLPLGLIAGAAVHSAHITGVLRNIILIAVDLGPNLSVTGSLATILWLIEIRKGGIEISAWHFLKIGFVVMLPALALATLTVAFSR
jgi:arsenical pump membrane protein